MTVDDALVQTTARMEVAAAAQEAVLELGRGLDLDGVEESVSLLSCSAG